MDPGADLAKDKEVSLEGMKSEKHLAYRRTGNCYGRKYLWMYHCNVLAKLFAVKFSWTLAKWLTRAHAHSVPMILSRILFSRYESNHKYRENIMSVKLSILRYFSLSMVIDNRQDRNGYYCI